MTGRLSSHPCMPRRSPGYVGSAAPRRARKRRAHRLRWTCGGGLLRRRTRNYWRVSAAPLSGCRGSIEDRLPKRRRSAGPTSIGPWHCSPAPDSCSVCARISRHAINSNGYGVQSAKESRSQRRISCTTSHRRPNTTTRSRNSRPIIGRTRRQLNVSSAKRRPPRKHLELARRHPEATAAGGAIFAAHQTLALIALREGRRDRAVEHMRESVNMSRLDPDFDHGLGNRLANYLLKEGERESVIAFLQRYAELSPG